VDVDVPGGWTLDQLAERVGAALSVGYSGQASGRVREVPDQRAIRYYTTIGLVDRPSAMRARTALYGRRHLLQLVAIKRLQAAGRTLAEVQRELAGATDAQLERVARVPATAEPPPPAGGEAPVPPRAAAAMRPRMAAERPAFWRRAGGEPAVPAGRWGLAALDEGEAGPPPAEPDQEALGPPAGADQSSVSMQAVRLGEDVTLLLEGRGPLSADEVAALRAAAGPLLEVVRRGKDGA
jgi:DNA-binding transcriptional MerR regulator